MFTNLLNIYFLVPIFLAGRTLYNTLEACCNERMILFERHWLQLAYKLALSLKDMHDRGVLHNDIKTDNVLVELSSRDAKPYFIDFGMATFRKGGRLKTTSSSDEFDDYLAPEVREGRRTSPKSDIYSLGIILQEIADFFCYDLSRVAHEMIADNSEDRPTLDEVADRIEDIMIDRDL